MTVSNKRGHRGEREVSRKTIARGMPGETGVTVVTTLVCFIHLHARLRVHWASGIPCALCFPGRMVHAQLGRIAPRECGVVFGVDVIARSGATKQSMAPRNVGAATQARHRSA